ncbi:MAG: PSD1 domain-containing protein [Cyclobacteriaceae bacterium]
MKMNRQSLSATTHGDKWPVFLWVLVLVLSASCQVQPVDFNTDVRPILNKNCIACHGGVKQSGGFGLIFRENAFGQTASGKYGIVPGNIDKSEMIARINHLDPEMRMPLGREPLKPSEIEILTQWIDQGANYEEHWAYQLPKKPDIPIMPSDWGENEVDAFIASKHKEQGLSPASEANPYDLIRRLYLDLTGVPPTLDQVAAFVPSNSNLTYEQVVDELIASPRFGEHWASMWLDLARYADTKGYEADRRREIWKYRDWVIKALNDDMPFDQFTIEQLAGDLLPDPTADQLIATAFHRNTLNNDEGGTDNEEYRISAVIDRVNTTWEVWQSTTMSCVQCHSHPYDPIKQDEYYRSFAFFNQTADWDVPSETPVYRTFKEEDETQLNTIRDWIEIHSNSEESNKWERFMRIAEPMLRAEDFDETLNVTHYNRANQDHMMISDKSLIKIEDVALSKFDRIYIRYRQGDDKKATLKIRCNDPTGVIIGQIALGKTSWFEFHPISINTELKKADLYFDFGSEDASYGAILDGFLIGEKLPETEERQDKEYYAKIDRILNTSPLNTTPIMVEKPKSHDRVTRVFDRGNWLVPGDTVGPGVPAIMGSKTQTFKDRLDLANWLVGDDNSLTTRVIVNRFWSRIFGRGIVGSVEDFGTLGEAPSHPALLDWLAVSFKEDYNWSIKQLLKTIVMSDTYRQSAVATEAMRAKDPNNIWLSRSPRVRLSAEQIRDQALAVSGLISYKMYGPSVMPTQPDGIWNIVYSNDKWETSEGEDAYRRGLYTFMRRSSPYPSFISFDASEREVCLSRRINTNTPLQALVTLNDPVYVEAARNLARKVMEIEGDRQTRAEAAYEMVMGKPPKPDKSAILTKLLNDTQTYYATHQSEAYELAKSNNIELSSFVVLANALMNTDEFIVKN